MRQASRRKFHYIYRITRDDGCYYIGLHSTDDLEDGYFGSGSDLWRSIDRHGKETHSKEILEFLPDRISLKRRERELIGESWKEDPTCLNKMPGGGGGWEAINRGDETHREKSRKIGKRTGSQNLKRLRQLQQTDSEYRARYIARLKEGMKTQNYNRNPLSEENKKNIGLANSIKPENLILSTGRSGFSLRIPAFR